MLNAAARAGVQGEGRLPALYPAKCILRATSMSLNETHAASTDGSHSWARLDGVDILGVFAIFFVLMNHVNMRLFLAKVPYTQGLPPNWCPHWCGMDKRRANVSLRCRAFSSRLLQFDDGIALESERA